MRSLFFLSYFISLYAFGQDYKIVKDSSNKFYIEGSCKIAKKQILKIVSTSESEIECTCKDSLCLTEISQHLNSRMQTALSINESHLDGPNCFNSILYSKGIETGLFYSEAGPYWLNSPYCKKRDGKPLPGDVLAVSSKNGDSYSPGHMFLALTETLTFNKSGPGSNEPYELVTIEDYFKKHKKTTGGDWTPEKCRFVALSTAKQRKCESIIEAYDCKGMEKLAIQKEELKKAQDTLLALNKMGDCSIKASKGSESLSLLIESLIIIQKLALKELGFEKWQSLPSPKLDGPGLYFPPDEVEIFFEASPDIDVASHSNRTAIIAERVKGNYSKLPLMERHVWISIYYNATGLIHQSLRQQF